MGGKESDPAGKAANKRGMVSHNRRKPETTRESKRSAENMGSSGKQNRSQGRMGRKTELVSLNQETTEAKPDDAASHTINKKSS